MTARTQPAKDGGSERVRLLVHNALVVCMHSGTAQSGSEAKSRIVRVCARTHMNARRGVAVPGVSADAILAFA